MGMGIIGGGAIGIGMAGQGEQGRKSSPEWMSLEEGWRLFEKDLGKLQVSDRGFIRAFRSCPFLRSCGVCTFQRKSSGSAY